jgi:hypothetical protein
MERGYAQAAHLLPVLVARHPLLRVWGPGTPEEEGVWNRALSLVYGDDGMAAAAASPCCSMLCGCSCATLPVLPGWLSQSAPRGTQRTGAVAAHQWDPGQEHLGGGPPGPR